MALVEEVEADPSASSDPAKAVEAAADAQPPVDVGEAPGSEAGPSEEQHFSLEEALAFKAQGNVHFQKQEYSDAILCYTHAIDLAPPESSERAVFFANRAACHAKTGQHQLVVDDCTACLELQPEYSKALLRRAVAREALDQPTEAFEDVKRVLEFDPESKEGKAMRPRLEAASTARIEQQKEEMLGKLKDLGNSVLGNFGLSLDNFKAEKNPDTGSYNISFNR